jgi:DNA-binding NarL/FixJ family response regulator
LVRLARHVRAASTFCRGPPQGRGCLEACDLDEEDPWGRLTEEDDVELHALAARGWSVSAIARHTGRDRKTIRKYLKGEGARGWCVVAMGM